MRSMNRKERSESPNFIPFQGKRQCVNYILADLQSFREALAVLQRQVDDLDELKLMHYQKIIEHEEDVWGVVQGKVSCLGLAIGLS